MKTNYEAPDIDTTSAQRQAAEATETFVQFESVRAVLGSTSSGIFSFGAHASRPGSGAIGDLYFETDRLWLYYYTGTTWQFLAGLATGTNATRSAITVSSADNGAAFFTTDQNKLYVVVGGAWTDRFVSLDLTTSLKVGGNKVIGARGSAVADVASPDATDLATVLTLANEMKAQLNTWLARARTATGHGLIS